MRRAGLAWVAAALALALAGCGGGGDDGDSGSAEEKPRASSAITTDPRGERILRDAAETFTKGKADMMASLQQDLRENDRETLKDDLWDLRNVIYEFDQALRRIEFAPGRAHHLSLTILEIDSAAIKRIDPILDAKKLPPTLPAAVRRAVQDAESIEEQTAQLLELQSRGS